MNSGFRTTGDKFIDEYFYAPVNSNGDTLKITTISWAIYYEVFIKNASVYKTEISDEELIYAKASKLLKYLANLTNIGYMCADITKQKLNLI